MKPQQPYQRQHKHVKGERVGVKEPSTHLGLAQFNRNRNAFFKSRGMPERAYGEYYTESGDYKH